MMVWLGQSESPIVVDRKSLFRLLHAKDHRVQITIDPHPVEEV